MYSSTSPTAMLGRLLAVTLTTVVLVLTGFTIGSPAGADVGVKPSHRPIVGPPEWVEGVDIAEDGTRFAFDLNGPVLENGLPDYGNAFVTQGYLYPKGTLDGNNGVLADGSPAFPDKVIGTWTCWGYLIGEGAATVEGPWVITTQLFEFDTSETGRQSLVTVGTESPPGSPAITRAVTGGTGPYARARGEVEQRTLGFNVSEGVNITVDFDLVGVRSVVRPSIRETVIRY